MPLQEILHTHLRMWSFTQIIVFLIIVIVSNLTMTAMLRTGRIRRRQVASIVALIFYMAIVYSSTVFTREASGAHLQLEFLEGWKKALFEHSQTAMMEGVLNILLFVPIGWLLVTACRQSHSIARRIAYGFAFSLFIELSQLVFQCGFCSVDDLVNNTVGCVLGIVCRKLVQGSPHNTD